MSETATRIDATCACVVLDSRTYAATAHDPLLPADPKGRPLAEWLPSHRRLRAALNDDDANLETLPLTLRATDGSQTSFDGILHRAPCGLTMELVRREGNRRAREQARYRSVATAMSKLGFGDDVERIVQSVTAELRQLGSWDHVVCWTHEFATPLMIASSSRAPGPSRPFPSPPPLSVELDSPFATCMDLDLAQPTSEIRGIQPDCVRLIKALPEEWVDYARAQGARSAFVAPIVQDRHRWGTLFAYSAEARDLSVDARLASHLIVEYAGRCIANISTLKDREFAASSASLMRAINSALVVSQEPLDVFDGFADSILEHIGGCGLAATFGGRVIRYPPDLEERRVQRVLQYLESVSGDVVVFKPADYGGDPSAGNGIAVALSDHNADWLVVIGRNTPQAEHRPNDWKPREVELLLKLRDAIIDRFANLSKVYRAANERLRQASHAKDQFLAMISHELRTPLNAILGWTRLLKEGDLEPDKRERALAVIERNAVSQAQLVDDLLDVSQIVNGQLSLELGDVDPVNLAENVIEVHGPAAEAKDVRLSLLPADGGPSRLRADSQRLRQVLNNLLGNAIRHTSAGDTVELSVRAEGEVVVFDVRDDGAGIEPEALPLIFERFHQGSGGSKRKPGGLGLGLSICRDIIHLHGGEIHAESAGVGHGSRFLVSLPRRATSHDVGDARRREARVLDGMRVMVVDDESDARELIVTVLERAGAKVISADSARRALESDATVDILVADIGMPEMDGYELVSRYHAKHPEVPAVAVTAFGRETDRERAERAGFDAHITKPVDADHLVHTLASYGAQT